MKENIKEILENYPDYTIGDMKKILEEREIQYNHYKLSDLIMEINYDNLKETIQELIDSNNFNTLREIDLLLEIISEF